VSFLSFSSLRPSHWDVLPLCRSSPTPSSPLAPIQCLSAPRPMLCPTLCHESSFCAISAILMRVSPFGGWFPPYAATPFRRYAPLAVSTSLYLSLFAARWPSPFDWISSIPCFFRPWNQSVRTKDFPTIISRNDVCISLRAAPYPPRRTLFLFQAQSEPRPSLRSSENSLRTKAMPSIAQDYGNTSPSFSGGSFKSSSPFGSDGGFSLF